MGKATEVFDEAVGPDVLVWPLYEVSLFKEVAGHPVDDRFGRVQGIIGYKVDRWLGRAVCYESYQKASGVCVAGTYGGVTDRDVTGCGPGA